MKDYQNDLRHLRCSLFLVMSVFFSACLVLLTAEVDACNDEGAGSSKGRWSNGKSIFSLLEECSREGEERRGGLQ